MVLVRNSEERELVATLADFERSFNRAYSYPYLFLNDETFTEDFMKSMQSVESTANMTFGKASSPPACCSHLRA